MTVSLSVWRTRIGTYKRRKKKEYDYSYYCRRYYSEMKKVKKAAEQPNSQGGNATCEPATSQTINLETIQTGSPSNINSTHVDAYSQSLSNANASSCETAKEVGSSCDGERTGQDAQSRSMCTDTSTPSQEKEVKHVPDTITEPTDLDELDNRYIHIYPRVSIYPCNSIQISRTDQREFSTPASYSQNFTAIAVNQDRIKHDNIESSNFSPLKVDDTPSQTQKTSICFQEAEKHHESPISSVTRTLSTSCEADENTMSQYSDITNILLLNSGDIEQNPGPDSNPGNLTELELHRLADNMDPKDFVQVGQALGFTEAQLSPFEKEDGDILQAAKQMLSKWLRTLRPCDAREILVKKLDRIQLTQLAYKVRKGIEQLTDTDIRDVADKAKLEQAQLRHLFSKLHIKAAVIEKEEKKAGTSNPQLQAYLVLQSWRLKNRKSATRRTLCETLQECGYSDALEILKEQWGLASQDRSSASAAPDTRSELDEQTVPVGLDGDSTQGDSIRTEVEGEASREILDIKSGAKPNQAADDGCDELPFWKIGERLNADQARILGVKLGVDETKLQNLYDKIQRGLCTQEEMNFEMLHIWNARQTPDGDPQAQLSQILIRDFKISEDIVQEMFMKRSLLSIDQKSELIPIQLHEIAEKVDRTQHIPLVLRLDLRFNDLQLTKHHCGNRLVDSVFELLRKWQNNLPPGTDQLSTMSNILVASGQDKLAYDIRNNAWGVVDGEKGRSMMFGSPNMKEQICGRDLNVSANDPEQFKKMSSELSRMFKECRQIIELLSQGAAACSVEEISEKSKGKYHQNLGKISSFLTRLQEAVAREDAYDLEGLTVGSIILHVRVYSEEGLKTLMEDVQSGYLGRRLAKVLMVQESDAPISDDAVLDITLEAEPIDMIVQQTSGLVIL